jgi:hypothetical protein
VQEEADGVPADGEHPVILPPGRLGRPGREILRLWKRSWRGCGRARGGP